MNQNNNNAAQGTARGQNVKIGDDGRAVKNNLHSICMSIDRQTKNLGLFMRTMSAEATSHKDQVTDMLAVVNTRLSNLHRALDKLAADVAAIKSDANWTTMKLQEQSITWDNPGHSAWDATNGWANASWDENPNNTPATQDVAEDEQLNVERSA